MAGFTVRHFIFTINPEESMAGDWLKMRNNLWDDPRVSKLCDITGATEASVIGALYWLWSSADEHTEDGYMPGLSTVGIDRKTGVNGFGAALLQIGWLGNSDGGVTIIRFEEHNGTSAKRRCMDAQRKATVRNVSASDADKTETDDGQKTDDCGAREEKRRIKKNKGVKTETAAAPPPLDLLLVCGVDEQIAKDWLALRKLKRLPLTQTALDGVLREAERAKLSLDAALRICCERGWAGFNAGWLDRPPPYPNGPPKPEKFDPTAYANRNFSKASENHERTIELDEHNEPV